LVEKYSLKKLKGIYQAVGKAGDDTAMVDLSEYLPVSLARNRHCY
jgi:hypothetical protein